MTLQEAIALVGKEDYDTCVATSIKSEEEFNVCVSVIADRPNLKYASSYGFKENANVFYYYPVEGYYGHFDLDSLTKENDIPPIMFKLLSKKQKLLNAIKEFR